MEPEILGATKRDHFGRAAVFDLTSTADPMLGP